MRRAFLVAFVLVAGVALAGCKKKNTQTYDIMGPSAQLAPSPDQSQSI